jgi:hypothetical protein
MFFDGSWTVLHNAAFSPSPGEKVFLCPKLVQKSKSLKVIKSTTLRLYDLTTL